MNNDNMSNAVLVFPTPFLEKLGAMDWTGFDSKTGLRPTYIFAQMLSRMIEIEGIACYHHPVDSLRRAIGYLDEVGRHSSIARALAAYSRPYLRFLSVSDKDAICSTVNILRGFNV